MIDKRVDYTRCQTIYMNTLEILENTASGEVLASGFLRELQQTNRCDPFSNLEELRNSYTTFIQQTPNESPTSYASLS